MFRLYDTEKKEWVKDNFYISNKGELFLFQKGKFGRKKLTLVSDERYVYHRDVGACDVHGNLIYEGDIVRNTEDNDLMGVVAYAPQHAAYCVFDDKNSAYYGLIEANREEMEIVGNVFDNEEMLNHDIEQEG